MRTAFVLQSVKALYGAENATLALIAELRKTGMDVSVIVLNELRLALHEPPLMRVLRDTAIPYEKIDVRSAFDVGLIRALRGLVKVRGYRLLHVIGYKANLHATLAAAAPVISTVHGWLFRPDLKERFYGWMEVQLLRRAAGVVCLTRFYEDLLLSRGVARRQLSRIPTGLDLSKFPAQPPGVQPSGVTVFGILARLSSEKNHELFLQAAAAASRANDALRFVIAGDGPERDRIAACVQQLALPGVVTLEDYMPADAFFGQVDALVLCSKIENMPMSILEAMAWAKPVIATRVGGVPDVVDPMQTGFIVEPDDVEQLSDAMGQLAADASLARNMGLAGRTRVEKEFSLTACVDAHVRLYKSVDSDARR